MQNIIDFEPSLAERTNWNTIFFVALFHILAAVSLFFFSWQNLAACLIVKWIAGSWGIGLGYHRLLTHRGFKAPKWLERFLAACGTLALQSGPIAWVTTHRIHHAFTETDRDPHSPRNGSYWAHIGWIFQGTAQNQPESAVRRYSPDLLRDPVLRILDKYYYLAPVIVGLVLFVIGGWTMVLWGIFLRTVIAWHATWLVNSATHLWGRRRFETRDDSRNNGFVAAVTFGEGWHNNHHAYPRSARHGLTWKEIDFNWMQISFLRTVGLVKDVYAYDLADENVYAKELKKAA
ncbi:MAG TPA: fatty acid desaturase [Pyrinomonadaceae bacterium]|nr:fatty acid desaturase [Pyrinomonadaceae bacterium]